MSNEATTGLTGLSHELEALVAKAQSGIVAVKAGAYRTVSGVCIDRELVAVADHTLKRAERVPVVTHEGKEAGAIVLGRAPALDLAILKVQGASFTPLEAAEATALRAGSLAMVIGLTTDVGPSVSLGVLGAVGGQRRTWRGGTLDQFIRMDVNLYPSQSGAAVINMDGRLIGLATPALSRHAAMTVSVGTIQRIMAELLKEGRIRRGYLGVGMQPVSIPESLRNKTGTNVEAGLMLLSVEPDSPAEQAGLQLGDIFVSLDDKTVGDIDDLQAFLTGEWVGATLAAVLIRGGEIVRVSLTVGERPVPKRAGTKEE